MAETFCEMQSGVKVVCIIAPIEMLLYMYRGINIFNREKYPYDLCPYRGYFNTLLLLID